MKIFFILSSFFLLLFSCVKKDLDKDLYKMFETITDIESNDTIAESNEANLDLPIVGFFNKKENDKKDTDFYKILLKNINLSYELTSTGVPNVNYKITILNDKGKIISVSNENGNGEWEKIWNFYPNSNYIFIKIESIDGFNEKMPYIINISPKEEGTKEEKEPNNTEEAANIIKINETIKGYTAPRGDIDYYNIDFSGNKIYDFNIEIESFSNIDINFTIIDKKNSISKYIHRYSYGGTEFFNYLDSSKGDYYIRITGDENSSVKIEPIYFVSVKEVKNLPNTYKEARNLPNTYYEREFNDTFSSATELISGSEMFGYFYPDNDVDFYKFELYKKSISVNISLSKIKGVDSIIELLDKDDILIKKENSNGVDYGESMVINELNSGLYYVRLLTKDGKSSNINYNLFFLAVYE